MKNLLLYSLLFILLTSIHAAAAIVTVTNSNDSGPGSLRDAIATAVSGDDIVFAAATNGSPIVLTSGAITITKDITLTGNGTGMTTVTGSFDRIFVIDSGAAVTIAGATLTGGFNNLADPLDGGGAIRIDNASVVTISMSEFLDNTAFGGSGGAIIVLGASDVSISDSSFSGNVSARAGGALETNGNSTLTISNTNFSVNATGGSPGNGGAVHITGPGITSITGGDVLRNTATAEGGGLWNGSGTMTLNDVFIDGNTASGAGADQGGGGIFNAGGTLDIIDLTLSNNIADGAAGSGGGILSDAGGIVTINTTLLEGNSAVRAGGGIEINNRVTAGSLDVTNSDFLNNITGAAPGNGGAVHITGGGTTTITGGTASGNTAAAEGGGLWNGSGSMTVSGITIDGNTASGASADQGGGGIFNAGGTLDVQNATITNNNADGASGSGGGILSDAGGIVTVSSSTIESNSSVRAGGGIEINNAVTVGSLTVDDTNIDSNTTGPNPGNGGGIHITGAGETIINFGNITNNTATNEGGGLWNGTGTSTITCIIVENNTAPTDPDLFTLDGGQIIRDDSSCSTAAIPTMGEWGLVCLTLLLLTFAVVRIKEAENQVLKSSAKS